MATQFQVDTERIQAASADIARISGEIDGQVTAMMARLVGLQDAWTGTASARFQGVVARVAGHAAAGARLARLASARCSPRRGRSTPRPRRDAMRMFT